MNAEGFDAASVAIFRADVVLLIERATEPYKGFWTLPGGRVLAGESAEECARREVAEELGLQLADLTFVSAHRTGEFSLAVFAAAFVGGNVVASDEVADWEWVPTTAPTALKTTPGLQAILDLTVNTSGRNER